MRSLEEEFEYHRKVQLFIEILERAVDSSQERDEEIFVADLVSMFEGASLALIAKGNLYEFVKTVTGQTGEQIGRSWSNILVAADIRRIADALAYAHEKIESVGAETHQVGPALLQPILKGIGEGPFDKTIQDKWKKLLTSCIEGKNIRVEYLQIMSQLDAIDARFLDISYRSEELILDELTKELEVTDSVELDISVKKLADELGLLFIESSGSNKRYGIIEDTQFILSASKTHICRVEREAGRGDINLEFTRLGNAFMKCVTEETVQNFV